MPYLWLNCKSGHKSELDRIKYGTIYQVFLGALACPPELALRRLQAGEVSCSAGQNPLYALCVCLKE